ncbi:MAG: hypothetical protein QM704_26035 [Anaeromyxobacteraceae bacterium]
MTLAAGDPGEAARTLARRLAALEEGRIRARAAARALGALPPRDGLRVVAALIREEAVDARVALSAVAQALADPEPELPYLWRADLYSAAQEDGAAEVMALLLTPPPLKVYEEPRDKADQRLAKLTLGHKKAFARSHRDPDLLARLAAEGEPVVVRELLRNPLLTEAFVVRIGARRPCRPATLRCIFESRWRTRPAVAMAVVRNPYAEPEIAVKLVPALSSADLHDVGRDPAVHPLVRGFALRLRQGRRSALAGRPGAAAGPAAVEEPTDRVARGGDPQRDEDQGGHEQDDEPDVEHGE